MTSTSAHTTGLKPLERCSGLVAPEALCEELKVPWDGFCSRDLEAAVLSLRLSCYFLPGGNSCVGYGIFGQCIGFALIVQICRYKLLIVLGIFATHKAVFLGSIFSKNHGISKSLFKPVSPSPLQSWENQPDRKTFLQIAAACGQQGHLNRECLRVEGRHKPLLWLAPTGTITELNKCCRWMLQHPESAYWTNPAISFRKRNIHLLKIKDAAVILVNRAGGQLMAWKKVFFHVCACTGRSKDAILICR